MPLVLAYLPALGLGWLASEGFHQWMAVICFVLGRVSFCDRDGESTVVSCPLLGVPLGFSFLTTAAFALEDGCCAVCESTDQTSV